LDPYNNLYVAGTTRSTDFPTTEGAFNRTYSGLGRGQYGGDVFVVKLDMGAMVRTVTNLDTGAEYADLQIAVHEALPGDTLEVGPGRYRENIEITDKAIVLRSVEPNDPNYVNCTIIQGDMNEPVLTLSNNSGDCEIDGLSLQAGSVGVMGVATNATLRNCTIMENLTHGIEMFQVSSPHLLHCLIMANGQAGIKMHTTTGGPWPLYCEPIIENCYIVDNYEAGIIGGKPVILDSVIQGQ
jgi:hypothetical protein